MLVVCLFVCMYDFVSSCVECNLLLPSSTWFCLFRCTLVKILCKFFHWHAYWLHICVIVWIVLFTDHLLKTSFNLALSIQEPLLDRLVLQLFMFVMLYILFHFVANIPTYLLISRLDEDLASLQGTTIIIPIGRSPDAV